jgi:hypothetical protein
MGDTSPERVQESFDRLTSILSEIVTGADAQAATRCPYRDRHDRCTARFRCRNQAAIEGMADPRPIIDDDDEPAAVERAFERTRRARKDRPSPGPPS